MVPLNHRFISYQKFAKTLLKVFPSNGLDSKFIMYI